MQTTDNTPLLQAFDADLRNIRPGGHWYNIDVAICEADASFFEARREQQGEYVAARLAKGDIEGAAIATALQHAEGFRANCAGVEFQEFRPAAWQDGWLDANNLGQFAPTEYFRMSAEA